MGSTSSAPPHQQHSFERYCPEPALVTPSSHRGYLNTVVLDEWGVTNESNYLLQYSSTTDSMTAESLEFSLSQSLKVLPSSCPLSTYFPLDPITPIHCTTLPLVDVCERDRKTERYRQRQRQR